jgi:hypothetical protein
MPYTYTLDAVQGVVFIQATGIITDPELLSLAQNIASAPG